MRLGLVLAAPTCGVGLLGGGPLALAVGLDAHRLGHRLGCRIRRRLVLLRDRRDRLVHRLLAVLHLVNVPCDEGLLLDAGKSTLGGEQLVSVGLLGGGVLLGGDVPLVCDVPLGVGEPLGGASQLRNMEPPRGGAEQPVVIVIVIDLQAERLGLVELLDGGPTPVGVVHVGVVERQVDAEPLVGVGLNGLVVPVGVVGPLGDVPQHRAEANLLGAEILDHYPRKGW